MNACHRMSTAQNYRNLKAGVFKVSSLEWKEMNACYDNSLYFLIYILWSYVLSVIYLPEHILTLAGFDLFEKETWFKKKDSSLL